MPARIIHFSIEIPRWLDWPAVKAVLLYRRLRYGYAFRRIPLSQGGYAIVDPDDYDRLSQYNWCMAAYNGSFYAMRTMRNAGPGQKNASIRMHREILKVPEGMCVDHINHNGLDNRKANLRPATRAQNARNRQKQRGSFHSKYKGVTRYTQPKQWGAKIMVDGESKFLGCFDDEIEAAKAYDMAAKKYHGDFASLNFPNLATDAVPSPVEGAHRGHRENHSTPIDERRAAILLPPEKST